MFPLRYRGKMQDIRDERLSELLSKCGSVEAPKTRMSLLELTDQMSLTGQKIPAAMPSPLTNCMYVFVIYVSSNTSI